MKVLVVGSGGREHALCWAIAKSPKCDKLFAAPGNAGIADVAECVNVKAEDVDGLLKFAKSEKSILSSSAPKSHWLTVWWINWKRLASKPLAPPKKPPNSKVPKPS